jgi:hypothetical protein
MNMGVKELEELKMLKCSSFSKITDGYPQGLNKNFTNKVLGKLGKKW